MKLSQDSKTVSIILRTNNSERIIRETLTRLYAQSFQDFELAAVDYSSSDRTREIIREFPGKRFMVDSQTYNPGTVLNQTIEKTTGDIVVFLNGDSVLESPHSLHNLVNAFENTSVDAAYGRQKTEPETNPKIVDFYRKAFPVSEKEVPSLRFSLAFAGMRRSVWQKRSFLDHVPLGEDLEWSLWAEEQGIDMRYVPLAVIRHAHCYEDTSCHHGLFVEGDADAYLNDQMFQNSFAKNRFGQQSLWESFSYSFPEACSNKPSSSYTRNRSMNSRKPSFQFLNLHKN